MLGEDFDKPIEGKADRDNRLINVNRPFIRVTSDGTPFSTNVSTSDGVELGKYGLVHMSYELAANQPALLHLTFFEPAVELLALEGQSVVGDLRCVCTVGHMLSEGHNINPDVSMLERLAKEGPWHSTDCPRHQEPVIDESDYM